MAMRVILALALMPGMAGAACLDGETQALSCTANGAEVTLCWAGEARLVLDGREVRVPLGDVMAMDAPNWTASTLLIGDEQFEVFHADGVAGVTLYENNQTTGSVMCDAGSVTQALSDLNNAAVMAPSSGG